MKDRYIVEIYKVPSVLGPADGGREDRTEQAEDQLNRARDFQFQLQGDSMAEIKSKISKLKEQP